jgi:hypothetical protein
VDPGPVWPWLRNEHEKASWEGLGLDDTTLLRALFEDEAAVSVSEQDSSGTLGLAQE